MATILLSSVGLFVLVFILDFIWARYTKAVTAHNVFAACGYSAAIYVVGSISTISYVANPLLILPAMLGAVAGTYAAMKWEKHNEDATSGVT